MNMKPLELLNDQEYLTFSGQDLVIIDKIQKLPENSTYYSDYVLVMICTAGKIQIEYDSQSITVREGEIFLGVPGSVLSDYMLSPQFDCKLLAIRPSETTTSRQLHSQIITSTLYIKTHPVKKLSDADYKSVFDYYNLICTCIQQEQHRYHNGEIRLLLNAFLLKVVGIIDRDMDTTDMDATVRGKDIVEKFVWMVNEDCGQHRFVDHYANRLHITPKYLSTLVRASLDRTPSDVIRLVTMKEIERRLRYTDESIKQISISMDFPNTSFFGKYFKQHSGMTPNSYRNKYSK